MGKPYIRRVESVTWPTMKGNILLYDGFEDLEKWELYGDGAPSHGTQQDMVYNGNYGMFVKSRTVDPADLDSAYIWRNFAPRSSHGIRFESYLAIDDISEVRHCDLILSFDDAISKYVGAVSYDIDTSRIRYMDSAGNWQDVSSDVFAIPDSRWFFLACEINIYAEKYVKVIFNGKEIDMSGIAIQKAATSNGWYGNLDAGLISAGVASPTLYLDDVLVSEI